MLERQKSKNPPLDPLDYCGSRLFITDGLTPRPKPLGLDPIHLALAWFGQIRSSGLATKATHPSFFDDFWHRQPTSDIDCCIFHPSPQPAGVIPRIRPTQRFTSTAWGDFTGTLHHNHRAVSLILAEFYGAAQLYSSSDRADAILMRR
jgi:hypothetical protein